MNPVTAADHGWIHTSDTFRLGWEIGYALILARGVAYDQVPRVLGGEPCGTGRGFDAIVGLTLDGGDTAGVVAVPGDGGDWAVILGCTDVLAMRPQVLRTLSTGGRVVAHSGNGGKPMDFFHWYEDGECRAEFECPGGWDGSAPDSLLPLMREVGCAVDEDHEQDYLTEKAAVVALAERLTGVRLTEELLCDTDYLLIRSREGFGDGSADAP